MSESAIGINARRPNPALQPLAFLIGEWATSGTHPAFPGMELPGRTSFAWVEGGAFITMRSQTDHPSFPDGVAIFASDNVLGAITLCWFDQRGISRLCPVTFSGDSVHWHHDDPAFMQRLTITRDGDGNRLMSKGEMSREGGDWTDDFSQVFLRR